MHFTKVRLESRAGAELSRVCQKERSSVCPKERSVEEGFVHKERSSVSPKERSTDERSLKDPDDRSLVETDGRSFGQTDDRPFGHKSVFDRPFFWGHPLCLLILFLRRTCF